MLDQKFFLRKWDYNILHLSIQNKLIVFHKMSNVKYVLIFLGSEWAKSRCPGAAKVTRVTRTGTYTRERGFPYYYTSRYERVPSSARSIVNIETRTCLRSIMQNRFWQARPSDTVRFRGFAGRRVRVGRDSATRGPEEDRPYTALRVYPPRGRRTLHVITAYAFKYVPNYILYPSVLRVFPSYNDVARA